MKRLFIGTLTAISLSTSLAMAEPKSFASPDAAVEAVIAALDAQDKAKLIEAFGSENKDVILSGDPERDRDDWGSFLSSYKSMHRIAIQSDGSARLYVGRDQWPFPVSLRESGGSWRFDVEAARDEILERRIGRNELDVIELLGGYVEVQRGFRQIDYDGDGVLEFASHILSSTEERDGLYWPPADGVPESPIGGFMARAAAEGYSIDGTDEDPEPYLGYYFQILTKQGAAAPGGAMDYVVNGNMVAGHAILAVPSAYGDSGIMSFMVGENGVIYESDLGEETLDAVDTIDSFDPGEGWTEVETELAEN